MWFCIASQYAVSNVRVLFLLLLCFDQRARDKPEKVQSIEIYNCFDYQAMRLHWNGCGLLLHEFCHLIHQFTLVDSLDNATVINAFESATKSGLYDNVLRYPSESLSLVTSLLACFLTFVIAAFLFCQARLGCFGL